MIGAVISFLTIFPAFRGKRRLLRLLTTLPYSHSRSVYGPRVSRLPGDANLAVLLSSKPSPLIPEVIAAQESPFTFIDVGANHGIFSLLASQNSQCEKAYAIEPNPVVFGNLVKNVSANQAEIVPICAAITERMSLPRLHIPHKWTGGASLQDRRTDTTATIVLGCGHHLLDLFQGDRFVVKIDVEGHEPVVIQQLASSSIWPSVTDIIIEQNGYNPSAGSALDVQMDELGFTPASTEGDRKKADTHFTRQEGSLP